MSVGALGIEANVGNLPGWRVSRVTSAATGEAGSSWVSWRGSRAKHPSRWKPATAASAVPAQGFFGKNGRDAFICAKVLCDDCDRRKSATSDRAIRENDRMSEQTSTPAKGPKKAGSKKGGKKAAKAPVAEGKTFKPEPAPQHPPSQPPPQLGLPSFDPAAFTAEQRAHVEQLSMNLARAAITAQGAIAEMALRQADRPAALSPDPFHVAPALTQVMSRLAAQPDRMMRAQADLFSRYLDLWQSTARRAGGRAADPAGAPGQGGERNAAPG